MGPVWAIVVAAGRGNRFGGAKQFEALLDRRVLDWSVAAARAACDGVVVVLPEERLEGDAVPGGATRSGSVRAGLAAVPDDAEIVVVHDAARPLAGKALFDIVVEAVREGADAAVPAVPITDSIRRRGSGTVDRSGLVAVQTPQAFRASALRAAHHGAPEGTDDASLVEAGGGSVVEVPGDPHNVKITNPDDLVVAAALLERRS
ncbi:MAG: 2-C-methyl-D-erythritol 4-phosphate cytidylyltransferase [Acidimicrobiaceae bacterium]|nr:2-C-methyl-D-erythritol 4-phosphate cytidylyltransferase [Acidimicrobiaceae bacterium]